MADEEKDASESSSVRDDLLAAMKEYEPEAETPPERVRDESGRFAPQGEPRDSKPTGKDDSGGEQPPRTPEAGAREVAERPPAPEGGAAPPVGPELAAAPPSWSNAVKAKWATLDPEVRAEIQKREAEVHRGFTKQDEERTLGREMQRVIQPYEPLIRASGGTPPAAVADLLNTAYILRTADPQTKARTIAQVCQTFGVDMTLLAQPQGQGNPELEQLRQQFAQLQGAMTQQQQAREQEVQTQVLTQVEAFGQDPKHPHFRAVSAHMGALMNAGQAKDMEEAYEMAVWARPDLRTQLLAEQNASSQREAEKRQQAEKARRKAVSVRGGPGGYTPSSKEPQTVREALEAAQAEVASRI